MKRSLIYITLCLVCCCSNCINDESTRRIETKTNSTIIPTYKWDNKEFEAAIDNYCKYADSSEHRDSDYIYVEAEKRNDCTVFVILLAGGAYAFVNGTKPVIDFVKYKNYDILLVGDFPNQILNIEKNRKLNVEDIVKVRFPLEYERYVKMKLFAPPLIYDYMNMTLTFKERKLINRKIEYY